MQHSLDDDLQTLEIQLAQLAPSSVSSDMLARMEQLMGEWGEPQMECNTIDGVAIGVEGDLTELEVQFDHMSPAAMSDDMLNRMSQAMGRWRESAPVDEKVIPFNAADQPRRVPSRFFGGGMLSAAAAVALVGGVTALIFPQLLSTQGTAVAEGDVASVPTSLSGSVNAAPLSDSSVTQHAWVASDALSHKVTSTRDSGVVYSDDNIPHRCIRIDYVDKIKVVDKDGCEIEIKTPGVNYMLIPVETN